MSAFPLAFVFDGLPNFQFNNFLKSAQRGPHALIIVGSHLR